MRVVEREAGAPPEGEDITSSSRVRSVERGFFGPIRSSDTNFRAFHLAIVL
jgi:hypothetical protein